MMYIIEFVYGLLYWLIEFCIITCGLITLWIFLELILRSIK
jgi:hypothetical protein